MEQVVERKVELAAIADLISRAPPGDGVERPAAVGNTRLLQAVKERARAARVVVVDATVVTHLEPQLRETEHQRAPAAAGAVAPDARRRTLIRGRTMRRTRGSRRSFRERHRRP